MEEKQKSKRGVRYDHNPVIGNAITNTKQGVKRISNKDGNRMMVVSENTGEIVAPAGFWQAQEVDKTQFVKLYVNGVKAFKDLSGAGTKVFEVLYMKVQASIGTDTLWLTFPSLNQLETPMGETTFYRGMKELLSKGFIAESLTPGMYYLNPDYMWNGDRLAFVKEYRLKPSKPKTEQIDTKTIDMFEALPES
ncbi:MAG: hypothetical protein NVS3B25_34380 [Hymenobacter sp.]